jgi:tRNA pseudouridine synthase 10
LASVSIKTKELLRRLEDSYVLCNYCLLRQVSINADIDTGSQIASLLEDRNECNICNGLMHETHSIIQRIRETLSNDFHFDTFLIGATLPTNLFEKEDQIRARFKIRGRENIKSQLIKNLRKKFSEATKKQIDFLHPDLTINLQFRKDTGLDIDIKMRPLIILGRYIKKNRGIPQRSGCEHNNPNKINVQREAYPLVNIAPQRASAICTLEDTSIQSLISKEILRITKGEGLKFSWIGSEDENSLVLGSGRPFFVQIRNPKIIHLNDRRLNFPRYGLLVSFEQIFDKLPEQPIQFIAKTKIVIRASRHVGKEEALKIKSLADSVVIFRNQKKKFKSSEKRIYSLDIVKISNEIFELHVVADGGLAIKQFVEGREYTSPNISTAANLQCECLLFDILDVCIKAY